MESSKLGEWIMELACLSHTGLLLGWKVHFFFLTFWFSGDCLLRGFPLKLLIQKLHLTDFTFSHWWTINSILHLPFLFFILWHLYPHLCFIISMKVGKREHGVKETEKKLFPPHPLLLHYHLFLVCVSSGYTNTKRRMEWCICSSMPSIRRPPRNTLLWSLLCGS